MDIGEERIQVMPPFSDAFLQPFNFRFIRQSLIQDVAAKRPIEQGQCNLCMRAYFLWAAFCVGRYAFKNICEAGLSQDLWELLAESDIAAPTLVPGGEQPVQFSDRLAKMTPYD